MTLTILCEGATERNFVVATLAPYLREKSIFAKPVNLGGTPNLSHLHRQINYALRSRRTHEHVSTMLDLYALGRLPGNEVREGEGPRDRVRRIEQELWKKFPTSNFIPYIQLHEFEALIFVDIAKIVEAFPDGEAEDAVDPLLRQMEGLEPELINCGESTHPKKRLCNAIPIYSDVYSTVGPEIVHGIGLSRVRSICPNFDGWLTKLEQLGSQN